MAPRANWKGYLKLDELSCAVALHAAASQAERMVFHMINRRTGHRVHRQFVDRETGDPVENDNLVKGYETGQDEYLVLEPDEIAAAIPESDKTLALDTFIACRDIDTVYVDRPYYLVPSEPVAGPVFNLLRDGMRRQNVAALARTVLFRRVRTLLIRPYGNGLIASTLKFDYEIRAADDAFADIPQHKIDGEMLDLAKHIIQTKHGRFDPAKVDDRYDAALAELVAAKLAGKPLPKRKRLQPTPSGDLLAALRQSVGKPGGKKTKAAEKRTASPRRRKAG
jgi:DNA end-binding protein Ku